jgi:hypothetical protein
MELVSASIDKHGLSGLSDVLQKTNSFIAGSYSIPIEELMMGQAEPVDDRDIDIWMMHEGKGLSAAERLSILSDFLAHAGYSWPRAIEVRTFKGENAHYKRMERSIRTILTLYTKKGRPPIQILILRPSAGSTPEEIVRNFDLTLMMRWYDGKDMTILPEAARALENRVLEINVSPEFERQNMQEWLRTARRFKKYTERAFELKWQVDPLNRILLDSAATIYSSKYRQLSLLLLERWNKDIRALGDQLPYLGVTMCPPATTLSHLRVFRTMNSRFFLNPDPRLFWSELTKEEQSSAIPVVVDKDHLKNRVLHALVLPGPKVKNIRTVRVSTKENVATLIKFPALDVLPPPPSTKSQVYSIVDITYFEEAEYLASNPKDHIIIINEEGKKYGLSRTQLQDAKDYMACPTPDSMNLQGVRKSGYIVQIPLEYNVYVPRSQLNLALASSYTTFGLHRPVDRFGFDYTVSKAILLEGADYVSADHCQTGTDKSIHMIYAIR